MQTPGPPIVALRLRSAPDQPRKAAEVRLQSGVDCLPACRHDTQGSARPSRPGPAACRAKAGRACGRRAGRRRRCRGRCLASAADGGRGSAPAGVAATADGGRCPLLEPVGRSGRRLDLRGHRRDRRDGPGAAPGVHGRGARGVRGRFRRPGAGAPARRPVGARGRPLPGGVAAGCRRVPASGRAVADYGARRGRGDRRPPAGRDGRWHDGRAVRAPGSRVPGAARCAGGNRAAAGRRTAAGCRRPYAPCRSGAHSCAPGGRRHRARPARWQGGRSGRCRASRAGSPPRRGVRRRPGSGRAAPVRRGRAGPAAVGRGRAAGPGGGCRVAPRRVVPDRAARPAAHVRRGAG